MKTANWVKKQAQAMTNPDVLEPLVLLPGMMCDARVFGHQIVAFSAQRAVHVAPITSAETVEELAQAVLATAPERFALAGLSMGAIVAMEIQRRAPERVSRIALMDTNAQSELPNVAAAREQHIVMAKSGRLSEAMAETLRPEHLAPGSGRGDILEMIASMALDLGAEVFVRQSRALQKRPDQQKTLRKLKIPSLILCGEHDGLTPPRRHEFMATLIPNARLEVISDAGHLPTLEQPAQTTEVLRSWLVDPFVLR